MAITIWRRGHLNVNDPTAIPREFVPVYAQAGYACVQTMLNPHHPDASLDQVPAYWLPLVKGSGMKNFGFVWADDFYTPGDLYQFVKDWRAKSLAEGCALTGFVINCEDRWEMHDQETQGDWSRRFLNAFRAFGAPTQKLSLALNTYNGCGGINLPAWQSKGARLYCQTFKEQEDGHAWPMDGYVSWAKYYGYTAKAMMKANLGTYKVKGEYPSREDQIKHMVWSETVGFSAWYAEGAGDPGEVLIPLLNEAKAKGVCY